MDTPVATHFVQNRPSRTRTRHAARRQLMTYGFVSSSTIRTSPTVSSARSPGP